MKDKPSSSSKKNALSRRQFLKGIGTSAVATAALRAETFAAELKEINETKGQGPEAAALSLHINGVEKRFNIEPRVTLLEALRYHSKDTGTKEGCDRASCGACTVLLDGTPVYSCMTLAIEAQGKEITTVEGLAEDKRLSYLQKSFVEYDGLMCGYCTPGFLMSLTALLKKSPNPSEGEVREACSGNLCRCGTYPRIVDAALHATGVKVGSRLKIIPFDHV